MSFIKVLIPNKLGIYRIYSSISFKDILSFSRKFSAASFKIKHSRAFSSVAAFYPQLIYVLSSDSFTNSQRSYSKKKKSSKKSVEVEEESESDEDEVYENLGTEEFSDGSTTIIKSVPSMRIDTIAKAALGTSKKKIEKEFYSSNIRLNGEKILKKSYLVVEGDEIDLVKGFSPENEKLLQVDRIIIKFIGKMGGTGNYPVTMQVFKALAIDNYSEPWVKSSV